MKKLLLLWLALQSTIVVAQSGSRVERDTFFTPSLGLNKIYNIYLPPGYDSSSARFPSVYFLRGHEREWFNTAEDGSRGGKSLKHVADSLIATGEIGNMILIGPSTASSDNTVPCLGVNMLRPDLTGTAGVGSGRFEDYLLLDLIPHIDSAYRTIADREHRGIDGFSLGGYTSVMMGVKQPGYFSSVGSYDGTHMWYDLDDPRVSNTPPDDNTWMTTSFFRYAFDSPRDVDYMKTYNTVNILRGADSAALAAIRRVRFHIHTAGSESLGNFDRGNHITGALLEKNILNTFSDVRLTLTAPHNWYHADLHAKASLVRHWHTFQMATGAPEFRQTDLPDGIELSQNFPNPFNPATTLSFTIRAPSFVTLRVYDVLGRRIGTLLEQDMRAGSHSTVFDARSLPSGVYIAVLSSSSQTTAKRMLLMR